MNLLEVLAHNALGILMSGALTWILWHWWGDKADRVPW